MNWTPELEKEALRLKNAEGLTYEQTAKALGTTMSSIKHKIRRLQQKQNLDKYKHTTEKSDQILKFIPKKNKLSILETHGGFGGMTQEYSKLGTVTSLEIKQERVEHLQNLELENHEAIKCDSEHYIFKMIFEKRKFDVIDVDPYGYPSRYFPHIFKLIDDGLMVITLPMIGVAQMNKLTIAHLQSFWGVDYKDKAGYINNFLIRLKDYAFMNKHEFEVLDISKFDRVYRILIKTKKTSLNDIVGLKVNRGGDLETPY